MHKLTTDRIKNPISCNVCRKHLIATYHRIFYYIYLPKKKTHFRIIGSIKRERIRVQHVHRYLYNEFSLYRHCQMNLHTGWKSNTIRRTRMLLYLHIGMKVWQAIMHTKINNNKISKKKKGIKKIKINLKVLRVLYTRHINTHVPRERTVTKRTFWYRFSTLRRKKKRAKVIKRFMISYTVDPVGNNNVCTQHTHTHTHNTTNLLTFTGQRDKWHLKGKSKLIVTTTVKGLRITLRIYIWIFFYTYVHTRIVMSVCVHTRVRDKYVTPRTNAL
jgi:hypothetical protein